jgi:hypothetical protein
MRASGLLGWPKDRPGRVPLSQIKMMKSDPEAQEKQTEEIKKRDAEYFGI